MWCDKALHRDSRAKGKGREGPVIAVFSVVSSQYISRKRAGTAGGTWNRWRGWEQVGWREQLGVTLRWQEKKKQLKMFFYFMLVYF